MRSNKANGNVDRVKYQSLLELQLSSQNSFRTLPLQCCEVASAVRDYSSEDKTPDSG